MNEAQWQNRMTMLVNSCDAYEDLWQPFFTLLKRYFAPLDMRILLNTESKDFHFEGLNIECVHSSAATYGERMTDALRRVKTEYTLLMLDDFFLREPVRMDRLLTWCAGWCGPGYRLFQQRYHRGALRLGSGPLPRLPPPAGGQPLHAEYAGGGLAH